jgi:hypothetical protein
VIPPPHLGRWTGRGATQPALDSRSVGSGMPETSIAPSAAHRKRTSGQRAQDELAVASAVRSVVKARAKSNPLLGLFASGKLDDREYGAGRLLEGYIGRIAARWSREIPAGLRVFTQGSNPAVGDNRVDGFSAQRKLECLFGIVGAKSAECERALLLLLVEGCTVLQISRRTGSQWRTALHRVKVGLRTIADTILPPPPEPVSDPMPEGQVSSGLRASRKRIDAVKRATPKWVDRKLMQRIYDEARRRTLQEGIVYQVDHIIPIQGDDVCGLHIPRNLQLLTKRENILKGNRNMHADVERDERFPLFGAAMPEAKRLKSHLTASRRLCRR